MCVRNILDCTHSESVSHSQDEVTAKSIDKSIARGEQMSQRASVPAGKCPRRESVPSGKCPGE